VIIIDRRERERLVITLLVVLAAIVWLGFLLHRSPSFAGSAVGGAFAVVGGVLMLVPAAYAAVKRVPALKRPVTRRVSMRTLLAWHIYAGVIGPILVLIHTGHKFESSLGIALTAMTLLVVVSGFVGRYLFSRVSREIRAKEAIRDDLRRALRHRREEIDIDPTARRAVDTFATLTGRAFAGALLVTARPHSSPRVEAAVETARSLADVEQAIADHDLLRSLFRRWLRTHIVITFILYLLMALHVWAAIHFGLRWFDGGVA